MKKSAPMKLRRLKRHKSKRLPLLLKKKHAKTPKKKRQKKRPQRRRQKKRPARRLKRPPRKPA